MSKVNASHFILVNKRIFRLKTDYNKNQTVQTISLYTKLFFVIIENIIVKRKGSG